LDGFVTRKFGDARPTKEQVAAMKKEHKDGVPRTNKLVQQLIVNAIGGIHATAAAVAKAAAAPPPTLGARISKTNDDGDGNGNEDQQEPELSDSAITAKADAVDEMLLQTHVAKHDRQIVWGESQSDEVSRSRSLCLVFARSTLSSDNLH
jgi:hypothetical protein